MRTNYRTFASVFIVASVTANVSVAQSRASLGSSVRPAVQLIQPGDRTMSCVTMANQINALTSYEAAPVARLPAKKKHGGLGFLGRAAAMTVPMVGGVGGSIGGALANGAVGAAQDSESNQMRQQSDVQMAATLSGQSSIESQRKARLMTMYDAKRC